MCEYVYVCVCVCVIVINSYMYTCVVLSFNQGSCQGVDCISSGE